MAFAFIFPWKSGAGFRWNPKIKVSIFLNVENKFIQGVSHVHLVPAMNVITHLNEINNIYVTTKWIKKIKKKVKPSV